jgi:hypothetical protein
MQTISRNGVTLSANASANGFPLRSVPAVYTVAGMGDFAERDAGRERRRIRRERQNEKAAFLRR